jgi:hypothetical protein
MNLDMPVECPSTARERVTLTAPLLVPDEDLDMDGMYKDPMSSSSAPGPQANYAGGNWDHYPKLDPDYGSEQYSGPDTQWAQAPRASDQIGHAGNSYGKLDNAYTGLGNADTYMGMATDYTYAQTGNANIPRCWDAGSHSQWWDRYNQGPGPDPPAPKGWRTYGNFGPNDGRQDLEDGYFSVDKYNACHYCNEGNQIDHRLRGRFQSGNYTYATASGSGS